MPKKSARSASEVAQSTADQSHADTSIYAESKATNDTIPEDDLSEMTVDRDSSLDSLELEVQEPTHSTDSIFNSSDPEVEFPDDETYTELDSTQHLDDSGMSDLYELQSEPEEDPVLTERMTSSERVRVLTPGPATPRDSVLGVVERKMSLYRESPPQFIVVERWLSPVNFRGYKFNRKKLLVYGVNTTAEIHLFHYLEEYYFSIDHNLYDLRETATPRGFEEVRDTLTVHYLLTYADSL